MSALNFDIMTEEEVMAVDCAVYEQLITLIRLQHCQKSTKQQYKLKLLQNARVKISKWQHLCSIRRFLKNNG